MASDSAETIKEFLVALGYKIDEASNKKFTTALANSTKDVFKLGAVITGTLAIADAFVTKLAASMDKLYFASKRTGSSIGEMNAFSYAVTQLGGSAEGAVQALESIASFRRRYGGASDQSLINFGVKPEDITDSTKSLIDLGRAWANLKKITGSDAQGINQANFLGIDEKTYLAITNGSFERAFNERQAQIKQSGIDLENLGDKNREFNKSLADNENAWYLIGLQLEEHLIPAMKAFNEWSMNIASSLPKTLDNLGDWLLEQRDKSKWELTKDAATTAGGWISDLGAGIIGTFYRGISALNGTSETDPYGLDYDEDKKADEAYRNSNKGRALSAPAASSTDPRGIRNNNPGNLRQWGNTPTSDGFAVFPNAEAGLSAMAANLLKYGERGWNTISSIVDHWAPAKDGNNTEAYKAALSRATGFGAGDRLNLNDAQTLESIMRAMTVHENGSNPYRADLIDKAARNRLSGVSTPTASGPSNVTMYNNTTVHAQGQDGHSIAKAVGYQVSYAGNKIIRNMQSAVT